MYITKLSAKICVLLCCVFLLCFEANAQHDTDSSSNQSLSIDNLIAGDIILKNLFPYLKGESGNVIVKLDEISTSQSDTNLQGHVYVGGDNEKLADIALRMSQGEAEQLNFELAFDDIAVGGLSHVFPLASLFSEDIRGYNIVLRFSASMAELSRYDIGAIDFSVLGEFVDIRGNFVLRDNWSGLSSLSAEVVRLQASFVESLSLSSALPEDMRLTGELSGELSFSDEIKVFSVLLSGDEIVLESESALPEIAHIETPRFRISYDLDEHQLKLDEATFMHHSAKYRADANVSESSLGRLKFEADVRLIEGVYQADNLAHDWPYRMLSNPRTWVLENVYDSVATSLSLRVKGEIDSDKNGENTIYIKRFFCRIKTENNRFSYWEKLPEVTAETIDIVFDDNDLIITTDNAASADLKNVTGRATITLPQRGDNIAVINLDINHDFNKIAALLNAPDVELIDKLDLPSAVQADTLTGKVTLYIPLLQNLERNQIAFSFSGELNNITLPKTPYGLKAQAKKLSLKGNNEAIQIYSKNIYINQIPSQIKWLIDLQDQAQYRNTYTLNFNFNEQLLKQKKFEKINTIINHNHLISDMFQGDIISQITIKDDENQNTMLNLNADFTNTKITINHLALHKPKNHIGTLKINATVNQHGQFNVSQFDYDDSINSVDMQLNIDPNSQAKLTQLKLINFITNTQSLSANMTSKKINEDSTPQFQINVDARKLDLIDLFNNALDIQQHDDDSKDNDNSKQQNHTDQISMPNEYIWKSYPFRFILTADKITGQKDTKNNQNNQIKDELKNLNIVAIYDGNNFQKMQFAAQVNEQTAYINYNSNQQGRTLNANIPNLGTVLKHVGLSQRIQGGKVLINGATLEPNEPMFGNFSVHKFKLYQSYILGKLLRVASIFNAYTALYAKGIDFTQWDGQFSYQDKLLTTTKNKLIGETLGMSMEGTLNLSDSLINLEGTLAPAYRINDVLANIPFIGRWITDQNSEPVIGMRYSMSNKYQDPTIQVNPFSLLTPGRTRRIFDIRKNNELNGYPNSKKIKNDKTNQQ